MNKKVLWYALGANIVTSFLGAVLYKYFCGVGATDCGDTEPLGIFLPITISGLVLITIAFFVAKWLKKPALQLTVFCSSSQSSKWHSIPTPANRLIGS
ncbi:MAG: hypothetical protein V1685_07240 [Parcubacteria group bacterium]